MVRIVVRKGHRLEYMSLWVTWSYERCLYVTVNGTTFKKEEVIECLGK